MNTWLSYVPFHVAADLLAFPDESPITREQRFQAVALFADVSGFTAISEALGKTGRGGTEELTTILNRYFEPMITLIEQYGGIIGKFGGDAMTILFPYTEETRTAVVRRAMQCAVEMQTRMSNYLAIPTSAGTFDLAMKAGLAMGAVWCTSVGDPAKRLEYIIAGEVLDLCADAEHHAGKGEIVVQNALLRDAGAVTIVEEREGFTCISALGEAPAQNPLVHPDDVPAAVVTTIGAYLHPTIVYRLERGQAGFINEHRKVTVLFVSFSGFDYDHDPAVGEKLQRYLAAMIRIVYRYDGYLNKVDMGDKGSKYIVLFGAPIAHENDEDRALRCALELIHLPGTVARMGINTGFVYAGQVGSELRREYTVMGDVVNLAARLMQAAQAGQVIVSSFTHNAAPDAFVWESYEPIQVKGKTEPIQIYGLAGVKERPALRLEEPHYDLPMVGRAAELALIREKLELVTQGHGQIIAITADAGMGKSRLNTEVIRIATERGLTGFGGVSQSYGTQSPYLVWHSIWRGFFGIDPASSPEEQQHFLQLQLDMIDSALRERLPLLGAALHIPISDNELTRTLEARIRHELLHHLLLTCVKNRAESHPLMFVFEDCHWIDLLSEELLAFIARNIIDLPVLMVVLHRPLSSPQDRLLRDIRQLPHLTEVPLTELSSEETAQLIDLKVKKWMGETGAAAPALVQRLVNQSQGNPFYIDEILNLMHQRGIRFDDATALSSLVLPDSLYSLIISRIDQLAEDEKITLKVASVIGRLFKASWVWGVYPQLGQPEAVKARLMTLSEVDLTPQDKPEPELEYLFKHITTQEVAYESMAYALRQRLHEEIGLFIEGHYPESLVSYLEVLAFHFGRSQNIEKQRLYFRRAGDEAKHTYANEAAIEYFQRLLALLDDVEKIEIWLALGEIWQLTGDWNAAEDVFRQAVTQAQLQQNTALLARAEAALGNLLAQNNSYAEALEWLLRARDAFRQTTDRAGLVKTLDYISFVYSQQGNLGDALAAAEEQIQVARSLNDRAALSDALRNMGLIYVQQRDAQARALDYLQQALEQSIVANYKLGGIYATGNLGNVYGQMGDFGEALRAFEQTLVLALEIGYVQIAAVMMGNVGEAYRLAGDYGRALACYEQGIDIAAELGDWSSLQFLMGNFGIISLLQGRYSEAARIFTQVNRLGRRIESFYFLSEYLYYESQLLALQGQLEAAQTLNTEALQTARQTEHADIQFLAEVAAQRLAVLVDSSETDSAVQALSALLDVYSAEEKQAALWYEISRLQGDDEARQKAIELYRRLYLRTPNFEYRERYEMLSGDTLPDAPPLPDLLPIIRRRPVERTALLARITALLERL